MKRNRISVAFVGVFDRTLSMIPQLDSEFCKNIFGNPYDTLSGLSPEGFVIKTNSNHFPIILINPQKILFFAENEKMLFSYIQSVKKEFKKIDFISKFISYGLNYEYEWIDLDENANLWLWNRFISKDISIDNNFHACNKLNFKLGINNEEFVSMDIELRNGRSNGIFSTINHHHNYQMDELPTCDELKKIYKLSTDKLEKDFFVKLIEK